MADLHRGPTGQGGSELTTMLTRRAHRPARRRRPRPRRRAWRRHPAGAAAAIGWDVRWLCDLEEPATLGLPAANIQSKPRPNDRGQHL